MFLLIAFAFLAGVVTILSPCILPILPIILSSTVGGVETGKSKPLGIVTGFIVSFTFFTLFLSTLVSALGVNADLLRILSVVFIAGLGVSMLIPSVQVKLEILLSGLASRTPRKSNAAGFWGGILIGLSLGLLWTPCVGPILASVITLAISGAVTIDALVITLAYSVGTAIPMLLIMIGGQTALKRVPWLVKNSALIQKAFGVLMVLTALAIFTNADRTFQTFILRKFPAYGSGLTVFEDIGPIRAQLDKLFKISPPKGDLGKPMFDMPLPKGPRAPDLIAGGEWFNLPTGRQAMTLHELRGKVVLIDFWTYTCINCQRTIPYLVKWWKSYGDKGLVIIGVHAPEFEFEKNPVNVKRAISDFGIEYPVVQDNEFSTWRAYENRYWPAKYLIDKDGYIRFTHFGEGEYDETEERIRELLSESGMKDLPQTTQNPSYRVQAGTPELYLGAARLGNFESPERVVPNEIATYSYTGHIGADSLAYEGKWNIMPEYANPQEGAKLHLNFDAREVYLVMRPNGQNATMNIYLDNVKQSFGADNVNGTVNVTEDRLYRLITLPAQGRHELRIEFLDSNAELFAFTFG
jgi:cytochrome c biogenesis protein CcdA/thiol-disulfide isomerase/thioredoxin